MQLIGALWLLVFLVETYYPLCLWSHSFHKNYHQQKKNVPNNGNRVYVIIYILWIKELLSPQKYFFFLHVSEFVSTGEVCFYLFYFFSVLFFWFILINILLGISDFNCCVSVKSSIRVNRQCSRWDAVCYPRPALWKVLRWLLHCIVLIGCAKKQNETRFNSIGFMLFH